MGIEIRYPPDTLVRVDNLFRDTGSTTGRAVKRHDLRFRFPGVNILMDFLETAADQVHLIAHR